MPTKKYALEPGGPQRLVVSWKFNWKNTSVQLDGRELLAFANETALIPGGSVRLPDGRKLRVHLVKEFGGAGLNVEIDGKPVPGSQGDPVARLKGAYGVIYFIAALTSVVGVAAIALESKFLTDLGFGWISVGAGALFALLGWLVQAFRSRIALGIALALFAIDGLFSIRAVAATGPAGIGGLFFRVFLIVAIARGFAAIRQIEHAEEDAAPVGPTV